MNKKIIIASIIIVAILVGVSLTSVVGYQSVESNFWESPLFNVRSNLVIDNENKVLNREYLKKGKIFGVKSYFLYSELQPRLHLYQNLLKKILYHHKKSHF